MRIANIAPTVLLETLCGEDTYHLCLASQINTRDLRYRSFYKERRMLGHHVILDNDAYEQDGTAPDFQNVLDAIDRMYPYVPNEVVLSDVMYGDTCAEDTVNASYLAHKNLRLYLDNTRVGTLEHPPTALAIPHGNTVEEWIFCATELAHLPLVKTLGIAEKDAIKLMGGNRRELVRRIIGLGKKIHLFGMMEDMKDVRDPWIRAVPEVQGVDGSKLVVWGLTGTPSVPEEAKSPPYPGRPKNYFEEASFDEADVSAAKASIARWRRYVAN
jgi:hypothetical protein